MRGIILFSFLLFPLLCCAQVPLFETQWGQPSKNDLARSVKQLPSGSVLVAGFSAVDGSPHTQATLYKLSEGGQLQWSVYFGDSLDDYGLFLCLTSSGDVLVCGETQTATNGVDAFFCLLDTNGNVLWRRTYGGPLNESAKCVIQTAGGDFVATGFQTASNGTNDVLVFRTDAAGNLAWLNAFGDSDNDYGQALVALPDSGCLVAADSKHRTRGDYDVLALRINRNGDLVWQQTYGDTLENGSQSLALLADGNFVICGETQISPNSLFDFSLDKIDLAGTALWRNTFGGAGSDAAFSVVEVYGGFLLSGYSTSYPSAGPISCAIARTDTAGNLLWTRSVVNTGVSVGYELIAARSGNYYVVGSTNNGTDDECQLLHADAAGWTGLAEGREETTLLLAPNPVSAVGAFLLLPEKMQGLVVDLYSASGAWLDSYRPAPETTRLELANALAPGLYLVRFTDEKGIVGIGRWIVY